MSASSYLTSPKSIFHQITNCLNAARDKKLDIVDLLYADTLYFYILNVTQEGVLRPMFVIQSLWYRKKEDPFNLTIIYILTQFSCLLCTISRLVI